MKKIIILIIMLITLTNGSFANNIQEIIQENKEITNNLYKELNQEEKDIFDDFKKQLTNVLSNTNNLDLLYEFYSKLEIVKQKRNFRELDYMMISFAIEGFVERINYLGGEIKIENKGEIEIEDEIEKNILEKGPIQVYYFWGDGCPACSKQNEIWENIENSEKYQDKININKFEIWYNSENGKLINKISEQLGVVIEGVPFTIIGDETFVGITDEKIKEKIDYCIKETCEDTVNNIINDFNEEIQKEENQKNDFYEEKYNNRLKEFDDVILGFQQSIAKDAKQISNIIRSNNENLLNSDRIIGIGKEKGNLSLNLDAKGDNYIKLNSILDYILNYDLTKDLIDGNIKLNTNLETDLLEENVSLNNDIDIKQNKNDFYLKINEFKNSGLKQFLYSEEKEMYNLIKEKINENLGKYIKFENEEFYNNVAYNNIGYELSEFVKIIDEVNEKEEKIYEYLNNKELFTVYEKLGDNKYKLLYNQNFIDFLYLINEDEDDFKKDDFQRDFKNYYLIVEDIGNGKYSLYERYNYDDENTEIIVSKNGIEYIKSTDLQNSFYYENNKIEFNYKDNYTDTNSRALLDYQNYIDQDYLNQNLGDYRTYVETSLDLSELHSEKSKINISGKIKEELFYIDFDINIKENEGVNFEGIANYNGVKIDYSGIININELSINIDIENISEEMNGMIAFLYGENIGLKSMNFDMSYNYDYEDLDNINIDFPDNYLESEDIFYEYLSPKRDSARLSHLGQVGTALAIYHSSIGSYPESDGMIKINEIQDYLIPRYLTSLPNDPLDGKNYYYISLNLRGVENGGFVIIAELENNSRQGNISANSIDEIYNMIKDIDYDSLELKELLEDTGNYYLIVK
ncbi:hypothetical protein [Candidatus Vampirococcus lugosii]|uniref:Thioredoxin domain-containing protein n=1 Tax=Candidatus Vampirococcus lugosii TaxID=2789015 RepID=A0ABS5QMM9_9BACT|nr:hypothetical protein [Candidatus Vampirococcus lugosii]MBS8121729.1 hypothetical protein [Candidatus Vampirococcus lugosii]